MPLALHASCLSLTQRSPNGYPCATDGAERVATLDARVTPRSIVLSAGADGGDETRERARERAEEARRLTARGRAEELPSVRLRGSKRRGL